MELVFNLSKQVERFPLPELAKMVKDAGFDGVDYNLDFYMMDQEHPFNGPDRLALAESTGKTLA